MTTAKRKKPQFVHNTVVVAKLWYDGSPYYPDLGKFVALRFASHYILPFDGHSFIPEECVLTEGGRGQFAWHGPKDYYDRIPDDQLEMLRNKVIPELMKGEEFPYLHFQIPLVESLVDGWIESTLEEYLDDLKGRTSVGFRFVHKGKAFTDAALKTIDDFRYVLGVRNEDVVVTGYTHTLVHRPHPEGNEYIDFMKWKSGKLGRMFDPY